MMHPKFWAEPKKPTIEFGSSITGFYFDARIFPSRESCLTKHVLSYKEDKSCIPSP